MMRSKHHLVAPGLTRPLACLLALLLALSIAKPAWASQPCEPPNVIDRAVCDMDAFYGDPPRQAPVGWTIFLLSGDADFYQDDHSFFGGPNLTIRNIGGTFKAGIYTQAKVVPGQGYRASISWGAPNAPDLFSRTLGIDPTGGTDPNAPTVIWGPTHWGEARILNYPPPDVNIDVRARALGETMTVFFLTDHPQSSGDNLILVDAIALYPDESAPAAEAPPPTATPEPPTATPEPAPEVAAAEVQAAEVQAAEAQAAAPVEVAVPPTETPTATPTATPEPPTATPTATPSPTPTATFTPVPTATWTPWPTATPEPALAMANLPASALSRSRPLSAALVALSFASFGGAGLCGGLWLWLRRRRSGL